jgi:hypothetical protein
MPGILTETRLSLTQAARLLPGTRGSEHPDPATLNRWILRGVRNPRGGARIKLEAVRLGSAWWTSREAVDRFVAALTVAAGADSPLKTPAAQRRQRERELAEIDRQLDAIGI